jgi:hypothetical protein
MRFSGFCSSITSLSAISRSVRTGFVCGHQRWRTFVHEKRHVHVIARLIRYECVDFGFTKAALPVEHAGAKHVALQLVMIEKSSGVDVMCVSDQAKGRQQNAHTMRCIGSDARLELLWIDRLYAFKNQLVDLRLWRLLADRLRRLGGNGSRKQQQGRCNSGEPSF